MGVIKHKYESAVTREEAGKQPVIPFHQVYQAIDRMVNGRRFNRDKDIRMHGLYNKGYAESCKRANDLFATLIHQIMLGSVSVDKWQANCIWRWKQNDFYGLQQTYFGSLALKEIEPFCDILMDAMHT